MGFKDKLKKVAKGKVEDIKENKELGEKFEKGVKKGVKKGAKELKKRKDKKEEEAEEED